MTSFFCSPTPVRFSLSLAIESCCEWSHCSNIFKVATKTLFMWVLLVFMFSSRKNFELTDFFKIRVSCSVKKKRYRIRNRMGIPARKKVAVEGKKRINIRSHSQSVLLVKWEASHDSLQNSSPFLPRCPAFAPPQRTQFALGAGSASTETWPCKRGGKGD